MVKADLYNQFWEEFFALPESKIQIYSNAKPTNRGSVCLGYENGISYWSKIKGEKSHTAIYISLPEETENKRIFNELERRKNQIHKSFGASLVWEELKGKAPCRIYYEAQVGKLEYKKDKWKEIQLEMIDSMIRFQQTFSPLIAEIT